MGGLGHGHLYVWICVAPPLRGTDVSQLASAFIVENITWGFPSAFGVFLDAYLKDATYMSQPNAQMLLPLIGTLTSGIMYCSGTLLFIPLVN